MFGLTMARWWFQIFLFSPLFGEDSHFRLIFFKWVGSTANQMGRVNGKSYYCNVTSPISHRYHPRGLRFIQFIQLFVADITQMF